MKFTVDVDIIALNLYTKFEKSTQKIQRFVGKNDNFGLKRMAKNDYVLAQMS